MREIKLITMMGFNGTHNELEQFDDRKSDAVFKKGDSGERHPNRPVGCIRKTSGGT